MTSEFLDFTADMTVQDVLANLRLVAPEIDFIYYIYVVDNDDRLLGVLSLKRLLTSAYDTRLEEIMNRKVKSVRLDTEEKEIAGMISKYDFIAVPVVDDEGRVKGVITIDDVFDLLVPNPTRRKKR